MPLSHAPAYVAPLIVFLLIFVWMSSVMTTYVVHDDGTITATAISGFSWATKSDLVFNWHPVLMAFGFILCSSQAVLVFVTKPFDHYTNKLVHIACHSLSLVSISVAAVAIFKYHNEHGFTNLRSVHSWIGLSTLILFGAQYVFGFLVYFFPGATVPFRKASIPYHIGVGLGISCLVATVFRPSLTGIMEQLSFNNSCDLSGTINGQDVSHMMAPDCVIGSITALAVASLVLGLILAVWVTKHPLEQAAAPTTFSNDDIKSPLLKTG
ncbi:Aste57867_12208 [Aphanomyces stellatus]|uniref:Aste57867_12208 protein n=1 Tax=Aphanomyces stellatus TaxID=120398 RepID=A0A485KWC2_9STRA|nr:hypothetical protein As57867_012163 [Aphanomyces stellatus]VFT89062.1 Aste57867_12208 [Aphanomyces stellatus]